MAARVGGAGVYRRQGYWHDWADTARTGLAAAIAAGDMQAEARTRGSLDGALHFLGRAQKAHAELERAEELFTALGLYDEWADLRSNIGAVFAGRGHLLVHGRQDRFVPFSYTEWLAPRIPGVETRFFDDEGHLSLMANRMGELDAWLSAHR
jgi:pimeloyl-ACP methyl ester carboxylesterase